MYTVTVYQHSAVAAARCSLLTCSLVATLSSVSVLAPVVTVVHSTRELEPYPTLVREDRGGPTGETIM